MISLSINKPYFVGVNWGAIKPRFRFFGGIDVDLDLTCAAFDKDNKFYDIIYFGNIKSRDNAIIHSGDDQIGDIGGDDNLDNETIKFDLSCLDENVSLLIFFLNSYNKKVFQNLPHAIIRLYENNINAENNLYLKDLTDSHFKGSLSMILGEVFMQNNQWVFRNLGKPIYEKDLKRTLLYLGQYAAEREELSSDET